MAVPPELPLVRPAIAAEWDRRKIGPLSYTVQPMRDTELQVKIPFALVHVTHDAQRIGAFRHRKR